MSNTKGTKPTRAQIDVLKKHGKFPDDYLFIGMLTKQETYKGDKQKLDRDSSKKQYMRFKNRSEGFVIELEVI